MSDRMSDYTNEHRHSETRSCQTCSSVTYFKDGVCGACREEVPVHIPIEQVKRYILKLRERKHNTPCLENL
jgi:L-lactate utilization protein LutB